MAPCRGNVAGDWALRPQATCTGSIPGSACSVPSWSHCWAAQRPPTAPRWEGMGEPPGTDPAWLASHPMFCSQSLECPGTRSQALWGDTGAISLISLLDRFLPHCSLGLGRLPAPAAASSTPSVSVPALAASSHAAGSWGASWKVWGGSSPRPSAVGPGHALNRLPTNPFHLFLFTKSFARDPLILGVCLKRCSQDLRDWEGQSGLTARISGLLRGTVCAQSEKTRVCVCVRVFARACVCTCMESFFEFLVFSIPRLDSLQEVVGGKG